VCRVQGDFKVAVYADSVMKSRCLFWAWHNTTFMSGNSSTMPRDQLDKVHHSVPSKCELTLRWACHNSSMMMDGIQVSAAAGEPGVELERSSAGHLEPRRSCVMDDPHVFRPVDSVGALLCALLCWLCGSRALWLALAVTACRRWEHQRRKPGRRRVAIWSVELA
jgi:hypothetical protein